MLVLVVKDDVRNPDEVSGDPDRSETVEAVWVPLQQFILPLLKDSTPELSMKSATVVAIEMPT